MTVSPLSVVADWVSLGEDLVCPAHRNDKPYPLEKETE
jgi:hypothetical protein